jgi:hypothetical protein
MPIVAAAIMLIAVWQLSRRPDVLPPAIHGSGMKSIDMTPVDASIYEYVNRDKWITNGRSITLRVPTAYLTFDAALRGGPQSVISISFDHDTLEPWPIIESAAPKSQSDALRTRELVATLSIFEQPFNQHIAEELFEAKQNRPSILYRDYALVSGSFCGHDMFWVGRARGNTTYVLRAPFDRANTFARISPNGDYDALVQCEADRTGAWCRATREFERFPLTVYFDDDRLCDLEETFSRAQELLGRFVVSRTDPKEGWGMSD